MTFPHGGILKCSFPSLSERLSLCMSYMAWDLLYIPGWVLTHFLLSQSLRFWDSRHTPSEPSSSSWTYFFLQDSEPLQILGCSLWRISITLGKANPVFWAPTLLPLCPQIHLSIHLPPPKTGGSKNRTRLPLPTAPGHQAQMRYSPKDCWMKNSSQPYPFHLPELSLRGTRTSHLPSVVFLPGNQVCHLASPPTTRTRPLTLLIPSLDQKLGVTLIYINLVLSGMT